MWLSGTFSCVYFSIDHPCTAGRLQAAAANRQSVNSPIASWLLMAKIEIRSNVMYLEPTKNSWLKNNMQMVKARTTKQHREDKRVQRHKQIGEEKSKTIREAPHGPLKCWVFGGKEKNNTGRCYRLWLLNQFLCFCASVQSAVNTICWQ